MSPPQPASQTSTVSTKHGSGRYASYWGGGPFGQQQRAGAEPRVRCVEPAKGDGWVGEPTPLLWTTGKTHGSGDGGCVCTGCHPCTCNRNKTRCSSGWSMCTKPTGTAARYPTAQVECAACSQAAHIANPHTRQHSCRARHTVVWSCHNRERNQKSRCQHQRPGMGRTGTGAG